MWARQDKFHRRIDSVLILADTFKHDKQPFRRLTKKEQRILDIIGRGFMPTFHVIRQDAIWDKDEQKLIREFRRKFPDLTNHVLTADQKKAIRHKS